MRWKYSRPVKLHDRKDTGKLDKKITEHVQLLQPLRNNREKIDLYLWVVKARCLDETDFWTKGRLWNFCCGVRLAAPTIQSSLLSHFSLNWEFLVVRFRGTSQAWESEESSHSAPHCRPSRSCCQTVSKHHVVEATDHDEPLFPT